MKRIAVIITLFILALGTMAQDISVSITNGIQNQALKRKMEQNISKLLSEVNRACAQERPLQLDNIDMALAGKRSLQALWKNLHFSCEDNEIVEPCLTSVEGYVIRDIYTQVNPMIGGYDDERDRALTIRLTRSGQIASVTMAASDAVYRQIMEKGYELNDMERRYTILSFVENYRSFYDEKDINAIERVFSEDAIIITGTVHKKQERTRDSQSWRDQITYKVQNKPQYISSLRSNFSRNKYIKVTFSDVEVVRHPTNPNYYGVTVHQHWKATNAQGKTTYEDDGYLLLIWEFHEGQDPVIHYRTWQPERISGHALTKDDIINILDFNIPELNN